MQIQFHIRGLNDNASLRHWLERPLEHLQEFTSVSTAAVVLEYERESTPAFRAFVLLAVPGPDIHAEARDHTLEAAWLKVTAALRKQIERRAFHSELRSKSNRPVRATAVRRVRRAACARQ